LAPLADVVGEKGRVVGEIGPVLECGWDRVFEQIASRLLLKEGDKPPPRPRNPA
jgi:hypothetical protein